MRDDDDVDGDSNNKSNQIKFLHIYFYIHREREREKHTESLMSDKVSVDMFIVYEQKKKNCWKIFFLIVEKLELKKHKRTIFNHRQRAKIAQSKRILLLPDVIFSSFCCCWYFKNLSVLFFTFFFAFLLDVTKPKN